MIFDIDGSVIPFTPPKPLTTYKETKDVSEFYTRGTSQEVLAVLRALPANKYSCIKEAIASVREHSNYTYRVSIHLRKSFFTRRTYEHALVLDHLDNHVFESHRRVIPAKPLNIAEVIG